MLFQRLHEIMNTDSNPKLVLRVTVQSEDVMASSI